jgi:hypothetical protein
MTKKRTDVQAEAAKRKAQAAIHLHIPPTEFLNLTVREWLAMVDEYNQANTSK